VARELLLSWDERKRGSRFAGPVVTAMRFPRSSTFAFAPLIPVAKVGFPLSVLSSSYDYLKLKSNIAARNVPNTASQPSAADLRHAFLVKTLKKRGFFRPRPRIYLCLRCKYAFLVNERHGLIVALDRKAQPIPDPENSNRLATFAHGPCPARKSTTQSKLRETVALRKPKLSTALPGILALFAWIGAKTRYPYFLESNLHPPDGIVPQDLLF